MAAAQSHAAAAVPGPGQSGIPPSGRSAKIDGVAPTPAPQGRSPVPAESPRRPALPGDAGEATPVQAAKHPLPPPFAQDAKPVPAEKSPPAKKRAAKTAPTPEVQILDHPSSAKGTPVPRSASGNGGAGVRAGSGAGTESDLTDVAKTSSGDKMTTARSAGMQKKSTRRGIRLKVDDAPGSDFD